MRQGQGLEQATPIAHVRLHLRVAEMGVRVHEADLAPEEGAGLGTLEQARDPSAIRQGAIEQARAVRPPQVLAHEGEVRRGLLGRAQVVQDGVHHGQEAIAHARPRGRAGGATAGEQRPGRTRRSPPGLRPASSCREGRAGRARPRLPASSRSRSGRRTSWPWPGRQRLMMQDDRPGAAQPSRMAGSAGCRESFQSPWP